MTTYLIQLLFGATVLLLVAIVANALLCRAAASLRHRVWTFALLGLLALPVLSPMLPTMHLPIYENREYVMEAGSATTWSDRIDSVEQPMQFVNIQAGSATTWSDHIDNVEQPVLESGHSAPLHSRLSLQTDSAIRYDAILCAIWLFGTSALLVHLALSIRSVRKMVASYETVTDPILDELRRELGIRRTIRLMQGTTGTVPFICGIINPTIVLPPQATKWSASEKRAVLTHELAHVVRGDLFWQLMTQIVCALYWFHPLVWFAAYRIWVERESACDDTVVLRGEKPSLYADLLLELANGLRKQRLGLLGCTVAMTRKNKVSERIKAILNPNLRRLPLGRLGTTVFLCVAALAIGLTATLSPMKAQEEPKTPAELEQEKSLAIAIPQDAPGVTIRGNVFMPDGSPADWVGVRTESVAFMRTGEKSFSTNQSGGGANFNRENGTFQLMGDISIGTNVVLTVSAAHAPQNPNKHLVAKSVVLVARENMEPLNITLEEGIPLRGKIMYDNDTPVGGRGFTLLQQVEPLLGTDIPKMRKLFLARRWCPVNDEGEFEIFLPPGDYAIDEHALKHSFTIEKADTEKRLDLTMPTPIYIEVEMPDGSPTKEMIRIHSTQHGSRTSQSSSLVFDPVSEEGTLYLMGPTDWGGNNGEYGTIEKLTPDMVGKTTRFRLKQPGLVTVTLVDPNGKPVEGEKVSWSIVTRFGEDGTGTASMGMGNVATDSEGKAVLKVPPGKLSIEVSIAGDPDWSERGRDLNLAPGETYDFGTVRLRATAAKLAGTPVNESGTLESGGEIEYIPDSVEVTVTDENDKPMKDVLLKVRLAKDNHEFRTGENGKIIVDTKPYKNSTGWFIFTAYAPDKVTTEWAWLLRKDDKRFISPAFTIRLMPGHTIGGTVVDEQGNPIAGAQVVPAYSPSQQGIGDLHHDKQKPKTMWDGILTDEQGKWKAEGYSSTNGQIELRVTHDDFLPLVESKDTGAFPMRDILSGQARIVLKSGFPVRGTVRDEQGNPLPGIRIVFGDPSVSNHPSADRTSDSAGRYEVKSWYRQPTHFSVFSPDWAPQWESVDFTDAQYPETGATFNVTLKKGGTIRLKVVDPLGEPIQRFWVCVFGTHEGGKHTPYLSDVFHPYPNEEGIWEWNNAPDQECEFDVDSIPGYTRISGIMMKPREEPYVVTAKGTMTVVTGAIIDAETKRPIENVSVIRGMIRTKPEPNYADESWFHARPVTFPGGQYSISFEPGPEPVGGAIRFNALRFEAVGYEPHQTQPIELTGQPQTLNIELAPSKNKPVRAVILLPNGKPAVDAEVALCGVSDIIVRTENDRIAERTGNAIVRADGNGRFEFPNPGVDYGILAAHPDGFAFALQAEVESGTIRMIPWARIEGTAYDGDKPAANASLWGSFGLLRGGSRARLYESRVQTRTDATGKFVLERVAPGLTGSMGFEGLPIYAVDNFTAESGKVSTIRVQRRTRPPRESGTERSAAQSPNSTKN